MTAVTIIGAGNMGTAIAGIAARGGNAVQVLTKDPQKASAAIPAAAHGTVGEPITGDIVILALPYAAVAEVLSQYEGVLEGKGSSTSPTPSISRPSTLSLCLLTAPPPR